MFYEAAEEDLFIVNNLSTVHLEDPYAARDLDRAEAWCCPCGLKCARNRREAHLRECAAFRDAWRSAIVDYLAAAGSEESARAVSDVAKREGCSADVALSALAESRGLASLAVEKLRHAAYRVELGVVEVAAMAPPEARGR
ncbi:hypothetical protein M885DRAFT_527112 [Pelagophyceae sp. CCMP2097]|nr:hypothetical protein M885DRAFT_527112 [Pelagophyceae sp. CCMP2097]